ncbi:RDD family protein [Kitasatospora sp. NPDC058162]|uniref:RDD family protein n=1 Tax=Kitasatospora sp. NPDC058162 TaxID=3346362 RepID=UPI0036DB583F
MSTHDPSGPQPEGGGQPSFDKQPPAPGGGTPDGEPPRPTPTDAPADARSDATIGTPAGGGPGAYQGSYGGPTPGQNPYDQPPPGPGPDPYGAPSGGPVPGMPPIGTWPKRIIARLIDYVLMQAIGVIVIGPFVDLSTREGTTEAFWLGCAVYLVYEALMLSRDGQTLGKKAMKIRVAMLLDGNPPTQSAAWTRAAVYILPAVLCCAGLWWIIDGLFGVFDKPYRQCLHDKAAKTVVVTTEI